MKLFLLAVWFPILSFAGGVAVSPNTPSVYVPPPAGPPKEVKVPPECVKHTLEVIFGTEKEFFAAKKTYTTSYLEMHAASKVGVGCPGWDLPAIELTYGGSGFKATMTEAATELKWIVNHDHNFYAEEKAKK